MIYLDNNATTRMHTEVFDAMKPFLIGQFGNPSSVHRLGQEARQAVEQARYQVAALLGGAAAEIVFTSGGTEADIAAIMGTVAARPDKRTIVTSAVEHSAVRETLHHLARTGWKIVEIPVDNLGRLDFNALAEALKDPTVALLTVMWANNETGVLFDVPAIGALAKKQGVPLHVDAVQAAGKIPIQFSPSGALRGESPIDLLAISAHKFHGPKGVGALAIRRGFRWQPLFRGGPQEHERRGGTENVAGIVGMGVAAAMAAKALSNPQHTAEVARLRDQLESGIRAAITDAHINGDPANRVCNTTNIGFAGLEAEAILLLLSQHDICASAGAACSSGSLEPSHVLRAMHIPERVAHGAIRFSLSGYNTRADVEEALHVLPEIMERLRRVLPVA